MEIIKNTPSEYIFLTIGLILLILIITNIVFFLKLIKIKNRIKNLLGENKNGSLEDTVNLIQKKIKEHEKYHEEKKSKISLLENKIKRSIQGVETLRFNPFKGHGSGGNQSFASSLIDENGDGVVFSTLYSRERVSVYAKPIKSFSSEYTLSEEEKEVISRSKEKQGSKQKK